jgi:flagellar hook-associated protein 3 FlgL
MPAVTLSDLSQMFQLRRNTVQVRQDLSTATQELSSGRHSDLGKSVSGNYGPLVAIDQQLAGLKAFNTNAKEATLFAEGAQMSLNRINKLGSDLGQRLVNVVESDIKTLRNVFANEAEEAFGTSVAALNGTVAGRSIFAGTGTNGPALASAGDILAELRTLTAAETDAEDVVAIVDAWFGPGGGFEATGYIGSTTDLSGYRVSEGQTVELTARADNMTVRHQLKGLALGALLEGTGITEPRELAELANLAGISLLSNETAMVSLQAEIGAAQHRIEDASARNSAERTTLEIARSDIVSIDPYKVATDLQNLQSQLETIYTITARLSGLSLTNFLR